MPPSQQFTEDYLNANKGPQVLAIIITFPCLAITVVSLRLYTRFKIVNNPSYEDSAILAALVCPSYLIAASALIANLHI